MVYEVEHVVLGTRHALKVPHAIDAAMTRRLIQEGRLQARLDPTMVLPVTDVLEVSGVAALLMPLVRGCSLDHVLARHQPTERETMALFTAVLESVASAHEAGVVHRDLKPGNILLQEQRGRLWLRVADFGIALALAEPRRTQAGVFLGTPAFAAPEQLLGEASIDHRADLWSLGVLLFEMLTGDLPFPAPNYSAILSAAQGRRFSRLAVPPRWLDLIEGLLEPSVNARIQSAVEVREELDLLRQQVPAADLVVGSPLAEVVRQASPPQDAQTPVCDRRTFGLSDSIDPMLGSDVSDAGASSFELDVRMQSHNLPPLRDRFIGREAALERLTERLQQGRLVTLLGIGGLGKTRLAIELGWRQREEWPGGVWFCDLTEARDLDGIVAAVGRALDIPLGDADPVDQLGRVVRNRGRSLWIFDNFEQVAEHASASLGRWLDSAPEARFLVTSRVVLQLPGERLHPLEALDVDQGVAVFCERARALRPSYAPSEAERADLSRLVQLLDGLPLAIELAAARARVLSPAQLLSRMERRFQVLRSTVHRAGRHATLRSTLDWSWDLLDSMEQAALAQLSVFEGVFTLEAAEAVIDFGDAPDAPWTIDVVQSLVDKSLVRALGGTGMSLFVSVRDYARHRLSDRAETRSTLARHGAFYSAFGTAEALASLSRHGGNQGQRALLAALDNIVLACKVAVTNSDRTLALACLAAARFGLRKQGPYTVLVHLAEEVYGLFDPESVDAVRALVVQGEGIGLMGQTRRAQQVLQQARELARSLGDHQTEARATELLATMVFRLGQHEAAAEFYHEALQLYACSPEPSDTTELQCHLATVLSQLGRIDEALAATEVVLARAEEVGDLHGQFLANATRGHLLLVVDRLEEADRTLRTALAHARSTGAGRDLAVVLIALGWAYRRREQLDRAIRSTTHAMQQAQSLGDAGLEGRCSNALGLMLLDCGRIAEAQDALGRAVALFEASDNPVNFGICVGNLGFLHRVARRFPDSERCYRRALELHEATAYDSGRRQVLDGLALLALERGAFHNAKSHVDSVIALAQNDGRPAIVGGALVTRARVRIACGELAEAGEDLSRAAALCRSRAQPLLGATRAWWLACMGQVEVARQLMTDLEEHSVLYGPQTEPRQIMDRAEKALLRTV